MSITSEPNQITPNLSNFRANAWSMSGAAMRTKSRTDPGGETPFRLCSVLLRYEDSRLVAEPFSVADSDQGCSEFYSGVTASFNSDSGFRFRSFQNFEFRTALTVMASFLKL